MFDIVAVGEPLVEFVAEQPGPLGVARTFRQGWGGDTANCVVAASRLGGTAGYITRLGKDGFGESFIRFWKEEGVDVSRVKIDPRRPTGIYFVTYEHLDRDHTFSYRRFGSAAAFLEADDIDPDYLDGCRVLHVSGISQAISPSSRLAVERAVEIAKSKGSCVSYDANVREKLAPVSDLRDAFASTALRADVVFVSEEDMVSLYPEKAAEEAVAAFVDKGAPLVVLTRGAQGCVIFSSQGRTEVAAWDIDVIDTTGAGDAFAAAFLLEWMGGSSLREAARFANAVGALACRDRGATSCLPDRAEVQRFLQVSRQVLANQRRQQHTG